MSAQPCLPQDILAVNRSKEYTLIATDLLESVLTDTRLNAQTTKLWQMLFNQARYNPNFDIKISYSYLAKKLGKSTRTIARYVESLQEAGYLIVKHNFDKNGGQRPSTISVRVPQFSIEHAKNKKDRHNKNHTSSNELLIEIESQYPDEDTNEENNPVAVTTAQNPLEIDVVLRGTSQNSDIHSDTAIHSNKEDNIVTAQQNLENELSHQDKIDRGWHDNNVIQIDNNKKDINKNNNNNTVVSFFQENEQISSIQNDIKILELQLAEGDKHLANIKDHSLLYDQIKKNSQIAASLNLARIALERTQRNIEEKTKQDKSNFELTHDPHLMLNKQGQRTIPIFTFKRLVKTLKSYGYSGNILNSFINEVVFEARFGSLTHCNKTKSPLSLDNAINIGLKLVREKRWSTPVLLKN
ncbi:MAG: helix-turn-helix domain-containing protein [Gammaproteobacteria bacterium]